MAEPSRRPALQYRPLRAPSFASRFSPLARASSPCSLQYIGALLFTIMVLLLRQQRGLPFCVDLSSFRKKRSVLLMV